MSHPVLTSGYAHLKDGCFPINQLDFTIWPPPKKRGKCDPPGHPAARRPRWRDAFIYVSFFPSPPFPWHEQKIIPTVAADPSAPLQFLPIFALRKSKAENDNALPVAFISYILAWRIFDGVYFVQLICNTVYSLFCIIFQMNYRLPEGHD